jgi:hypothetical protein
MAQPNQGVMLMTRVHEGMAHKISPSLASRVVAARNAVTKGCATGTTAADSGVCTAMAFWPHAI